MNSRYRTAALIITIGMSLSAFVSFASAATPPNALLIAPGEPYGLPKFGFSSSNISFGERVIFVRPGGRAARLGLEPGDVILSLNGSRLNYTGSWNDALSRALYAGGFVQLQVRDVRTGRVISRDTYVGYGGGPVTQYYTAGVNTVPQRPVIHRNSGIHTINVAHLFD